MAVRVSKAGNDKIDHADKQLWRAMAAQFDARQLITLSNTRTRNQPGLAAVNLDTSDIHRFELSERSRFTVSGVQDIQLLFVNMNYDITTRHHQQVQHSRHSSRPESVTTHRHTAIVPLIGITVGDVLRVAGHAAKQVTSSLTLTESSYLSREHHQRELSYRRCLERAPGVDTIHADPTHVVGLIGGNYSPQCNYASVTSWRDFAGTSSVSPSGPGKLAPLSTLTFSEFCNQVLYMTQSEFVEWRKTNGLTDLRNRQGMSPAILLGRCASVFGVAQSKDQHIRGPWYTSLARRLVNHYLHGESLQSNGFVDDGRDHPREIKFDQPLLIPHALQHIAQFYSDEKKDVLLKLQHDITHFQPSSAQQMKMCTHFPPAEFANLSAIPSYYPLYSLCNLSVRSWREVDTDHLHNFEFYSSRLMNSRFKHRLATSQRIGRLFEQQGTNRYFCNCSRCHSLPGLKGSMKRATFFMREQQAGALDEFDEESLLDQAACLNSANNDRNDDDHDDHDDDDSDTNESGADKSVQDDSLAIDMTSSQDWPQLCRNTLSNTSPRGVWSRGEFDAHAIVTNSTLTSSINSASVSSNSASVSSNSASVSSNSASVSSNDDHADSKKAEDQQKAQEEDDGGDDAFVHVFEETPASTAPVSTVSSILSWVWPSSSQ